jgi:ATP-dependent DNA helicase RecG
MADTPVTGAEFKQQLREGQPKIGLFVNSHSPTVVEQLAHTGYDWLLIDTQHGPMNYEKLSTMIRPFISQQSNTINEKMRKEYSWIYPWEAVRETIINAIAHRDWTRSVDIEVVVYSDRIEVISPGSLQNSMTVEKMKAGQRSPRNPLIVGVMRDYGYVDARGMGVRTKVIPLMRQQNQSDPEFLATEDFLKTILRRKIS